jgi:hypothetical protein
MDHSTISDIFYDVSLKRYDYEKRIISDRINSGEDLSEIAKQLAEGSHIIKVLYLMCISCARIKATEYPIQYDLGCKLGHQLHGLRQMCMTTCFGCMNAKTHTSYVPVEDQIDMSLLKKIPFSAKFILQNPIYEKLCEYSVGSVGIVASQYGVAYIPTSEVMDAVNTFWKKWSISLVDGKIVAERIMPSISNLLS